MSANTGGGAGRRRAECDGGRDTENRSGTTHGGSGAGAGAPSILPLELSEESVVQALAEFCQSGYSRRMCDFLQVSPTDYGTLEGMFDKTFHEPSWSYKRVQLHGRRVEFKLKEIFHQREGLRDRLATYLRARVPQVSEVHVMIRDGVDIY